MCHRHTGQRTEILHRRGRPAGAGVAETKVFPRNLRHLFARTYYDLEKDIVRLALVDAPARSP